MKDRPDETADRRMVAIGPMRRSVDFTISIPGGKSEANRALLLAAAAEGESTLRHVPDSDDIRAALSAVSALGVPVIRNAPGEVTIRGDGLRFPRLDGDIDIRSSGTVGRFLPGLLAAAPAGRWRLVSTDQLARRPLAPLLEALGAWGADVRRERDGASFPLLVAGGGLAGGETAVSAAASSQFASGLLMAAPLCRKTAVVVIRDLDPGESYIDMTLELMRRFGVITESAKSGTNQLVRTPAPQKYRAADVGIEGDFNSALYFLSLPLLVGGRATVDNLNAESRQPGRLFLDVLRRLGGVVEPGRRGLTVTAGGGTLRGGFTVDMRAMSEMALTLGVLAVFADAPITMTNLAHIRGHETDRLDALARSLKQVGVRSEQGTDRITVHPLARESLRRATVDSLGDHRLAMSFALLALGGAGLDIANPGAVAKTFPDFFERLAKCGADVS